MYPCPSPAARNWLYQCESPTSINLPQIVTTSPNVTNQVSTPLKVGVGTVKGGGTPPSVKNYGWAELSDVLFSDGALTPAARNSKELQKHMTKQSMTCPAKQTLAPPPAADYIDLTLLEALINSSSPHHSKLGFLSKRPFSAIQEEDTYNHSKSEPFLGNPPSKNALGNVGEGMLNSYTSPSPRLQTPMKAFYQPFTNRQNTEEDYIDRINSKILRNTNYKPEYASCEVPQLIGESKVVRVPSLALTLKKALDEPIIGGDDFDFPITSNGQDLLQMQSQNLHEVIEAATESTLAMPCEASVDAPELTTDDTLYLTEDNDLEPHELELETGEHVEAPGQTADDGLQGAALDAPFSPVQAVEWPCSSFTLPATLGSSCHVDQRRPNSGSSLPPTSTYPDLATPSVPGPYHASQMSTERAHFDHLSWSAPHHAAIGSSSPSFGKLSFGSPDCGVQPGKKPSYSFAEPKVGYLNGGYQDYERGVRYGEGLYEAGPPAQYDYGARPVTSDEEGAACGCGPSGNILKHLGRKLLRRKSSRKTVKAQRFGQERRPEPLTQDNFLCRDYEISPSPLV
eukprot:GHVN01056718.1.p1 GENE.GHVN01056718.1~~GHVN01056718.1.p1  ORF type:complete len:569 (-),score=56.54 GHVN01056718.1:2059-3765(-)